MSNEEQAPRDSGHDPEPDVVDPDDIVLDDGDVSAGTREPRLSVSPETLDLQEPALAPAQISRDTAEAASLEDAAAEARAVAAAAEEAGTLVGGPLPAAAPVVRAAPEGTAPAGGPAGDTAPVPAAPGATGHSPSSGRDAAGGTPARDVPAGADPLDDGSGGASHDPVGGPYAFAPQGGEPGLGHPGPYPGSIGATGPESTDGHDPADPDARTAWTPTGPDHQDTGAHAQPGRTRSGGSALPLLIGGAVVLLGLLTWLLVSLLGGDDEDRVDPSSIPAGACLTDFTDVTEDAAPADCSDPHNAQLLASEAYPEDAEFPGPEQVGLRAEAACATAAADVNPDAVTDLQVTLLRATPTEATWADGDRRVDCFAVIGDGGTVSRSLLEP